MNQIFAIPAFTDNYIWCIHDGKNATVVDPGDAAPVIQALEQQSLVLRNILITHHHFDHTGGIEKLIEANPDVIVYGPQNPSIKNVGVRLSEGDHISIESPKISLKIAETPGHTMDHIIFYNDELVFCGDTLFSAGCGRMFEGTPEVFYQSLMKLAQLPSKTKVYCAHEYTLANLKFALHVDGDNTELKKYQEWAKAKRADDKITLPSTIETQLQVNPFLRCNDKQIKQNIENLANLTTSSEVEVFAALRDCKDHF